MTHDEFYCAVANYKEDRAIKHFGIPGQKWGVRRFQNADGSWTAAGRERYSKALSKYDRKIAKGGSERKIARLKQKRAATYLRMKTNEEANKAYSKNLHFRRDVDYVRANGPKVSALGGAIGFGASTGYASGKEARRRNVYIDKWNDTASSPYKNKYGFIPKMKRYSEKGSAIAGTIVGAAGGSALGAAVGGIATHNARKRLNAYQDRFINEAVKNDKQAKKAYETVRGTKYERKVRKRGV